MQHSRTFHTHVRTTRRSPWDCPGRQQRQGRRRTAATLPRSPLRVRATFPSPGAAPSTQTAAKEEGAEDMPCARPGMLDTFTQQRVGTVNVRNAGPDQADVGVDNFFSCTNQFDYYHLHFYVA